MSNDERFTTAKKTSIKARTQTFLDGMDISNDGDPSKVLTSKYYKDRGEETQDPVGYYAIEKHYGDGRIEYFVKVATAGPNVGRMLNPWGINYKLGDEYAFESTMGRHRYESVRVNRNVFNSYISFLKTKNESHLRNAERECLNGR